MLELWHAVIEAGKADGSIDPTLDTNAIVRIVTSCVHALIDTVRYTDMPGPDDEPRDLAGTLNRVLLDGITSRAGRREPGVTSSATGPARTGRRKEGARQR